MRDYARFLKDVEEAGEVVFKRCHTYEILDENKDYYFIQRAKGTNEVSQFHKNLENEMFVLILKGE